MKKKHALLKQALSGVLSAVMVLGSPAMSFASPTTEMKTEAKQQGAVSNFVATGDAPVASPSNPVATDSNAYVLMNIPYDKFYENELENDVRVDGFTSATRNKTRTGTLVDGSYHTKKDGTSIDGITFPVKVGEGVDLSGFKKVTDEDSVEITVTNRGNTSTTVYEGREALFENEKYAYYVLSEEPELYKEMTVEDGTVRFGKVTGEAAEPIILDDVEAVLETESSYGDYQLTLGTDVFKNAKVYAVVLGTEEGSSYGLRHLENIWQKTKLAWCTGFTTAVHNCPTSSAHYEAIMGQRIDEITYYTDQGIYEIRADIYVPKKFSGSVSVADAMDVDGKTTIKLPELPGDFEAEYFLDGEPAEVENSVLNLGNAKIGIHTLTVKDKNGVYADLNAEFIIETDEMPARYEASRKALVAASDVSREAFADYLANITSVKVNGKSYAASGRGAVVIINKDGTLKTDAEPIAKDGTYEIAVVSTGYAKEMTFTYSTAEETEDVYVLMNIPYADFYQAEVNNSVAVDGFTSATKSKPRTGTLAGGSYHVKSDGSAIDGITFPVKVGTGVDLSAYKQVKDTDSVEITVTNRGQTSTIAYQGKDALFENETYAYYVLSETPKFYKEATKGADGKLVFGKTVGSVEEIEGTADLKTETSYGDYQLTVEAETLADAKVYAVVLSTKEGSSYGLRHLENIWRVTNLAWSTGFTKAVHNCPTSSDHYRNMMGQTINKITYYTEQGIFEIPVNVYVPVKFGGTVAVDDASIHAGKTSVTVTGLPSDYKAVYLVEGLKVSVSGNELSFSGAAKGEYELVVSDEKGKYADLVGTFILYTEEMPARYNFSSRNPALVAAWNASAAEFADYLKNITSVSVDGKEYPASGRGAVVIINADGTLKTDAEPLEGTDSHKIAVSSTGYLPFTFTYTPYRTSSGSSSGVDSEGSGSGSSSGTSKSQAAEGRWVSGTSASGQTIWTYRAIDTDKHLYAGMWGYIRNPYASVGQNDFGWFRFDEEGIMQTGWFTDSDGNVYYLNPSADGCQGMMLTGWQLIDGKWYFFRDWTGAPYGSLLKNGRTPDGYTVDGNGIWKV